MATTLFCDLETYSPTPISCGSHKYAEGEGARILLWGYAVNDAPAKVWQVGLEPMPEDLKAAIEAVRTEPDARHVWHNGINFDTVFIEHVMPEWSMPLSKIDDTMLIAYQHGLPGSLGDLSNIYKLGEDKAKDRDGARLIRLFCVPRPDNGGKPFTKDDHPEDWAKFVNYCRLDVEAERELYKRLPKFNADIDRELMLLDARINRRGMTMDVALAEAAVVATENEQARRKARTLELTNGELDSATRTQATIDYINKTWGVELANMRKGELERLCENGDLPEPMRELLRIRLGSARASTKKFQALLNAVGSDGRLRGCLQFRGASRTGRFCLTGDHEVLTPTGWVRLDQWRGGRIAVWNKDSEAISFQESKALVFDYSGPMYWYDSVRCAQISTPDHKMAYMTKSGRWEVDTVENLANRPSLRIPFTGLRKAPATIEHDLLRILIMTQADGRYTEDGQVIFNFKKDRKVRRCKQLLRRAGIPFTFDKYGSGVVRIGIRSRDVPLWLRLFRGKEYGYWLLNESSDIIFDELPEWDGYRCGPNSIQYCTKAKRNADLIQALAVLSGRTATMLVKKPEKDNWADCYVVNIWNTPGKAHTLPRPTVIEFDGEVYCASTPTGFFVVRRDGRVWITGNSGRLFQPQNLPRPTMSDAAIETAIGDLKAGCADLLYPDVGAAAANCLRGAIIVPEGKRMAVADYSNIEGRVLAWLAGEKWKLDAFREYDTLLAKDGSRILPEERYARRHEIKLNDKGEPIHVGHDLYKLTYSKAFNVDVETVTKTQRQMGKVLELAMGYGGGVGAFVTFATGYGIDLKAMAEAVLPTIPGDIHEQAEKGYEWAAQKGKLPSGMSRAVWVACDSVKRLWRCANRNIVGLWSDFDLAIAQAFESGRGQWVARARLRVWVSKGWLLMRLPSGRYLCYPGARFGEEGCTFSYMGVHQISRKWLRIKTYAGKMCLAGDVKVVTKRGLANISEVTRFDSVWDGHTWVSHGGVVYKGVKDTITTHGIRMTPDHQVLTEEGWKDGATCERYNRADCRLPSSAELRKLGWSKGEMECALHGLRANDTNSWVGASEDEETRRHRVVRLHAEADDFAPINSPRYDEAPGICGVAFDEGALRNAHAPSVQKLRCAWHTGLRKMESVIRKLLGGYGPDMEEGLDLGPHRQRQGVLPGELPVGRVSRASEQQKKDGAYRRKALSGLVERDRDRHDDALLQTGPRVPEGAVVRKAGCTEPVYDILNCGPRHQFVVAAEGGPLIVHNCENATQAIACDVLTNALFSVEQAGFAPVLTVHDEVLTEAPDDEAHDAFALEHAMETRPAWAQDLPLTAAGFTSYRYHK